MVECPILPNRYMGHESRFGKHTPDTGRNRRFSYRRLFGLQRNDAYHAEISAKARDERYLRTVADLVDQLGMREPEIVPSEYEDTPEAREQFLKRVLDQGVAQMTSDGDVRLAEGYSYTHPTRRSDSRLTMRGSVAIERNIRYALPQEQIGDIYGFREATVITSTHLQEFLRFHELPPVVGDYQAAGFTARRPCLEEDQALLHVDAVEGGRPDAHTAILRYVMLKNGSIDTDAFTFSMILPENVIAELSSRIPHDPTIIHEIIDRVATQRLGIPADQWYSSTTDFAERGDGIQQSPRRPDFESLEANGALMFWNDGMQDDGEYTPEFRKLQRLPSDHILRYGSGPHEDVPDEVFPADNATKQRRIEAAELYARRWYRGSFPLHRYTGEQAVWEGIDFDQPLPPIELDSLRHGWRILTRKDIYQPLAMRQPDARVGESERTRSETDWEAKVQQGHDKNEGEDQAPRVTRDKRTISDRERERNKGRDERGSKGKSI